MNIFYLSNCPQEAAVSHNDKHCVKMILEYAQMLSTAHRELDGDSAPQDLYKSTHKNHPSTVWTRASKQHYVWLFKLFTQLAAEYTRRYGKVHKSWNTLASTLYHPPKNLKDNGWKPPPQCMPDSCKKPDTIDAYRNYYMKEKRTFSTWKNPSFTPSWFT